MTDSTTPRLCPRCQQEKPQTLEFFGSNKARRSDPWQTYCRPCLKEYNREYRDKYPDLFEARKKADYAAVRNDPDKWAARLALARKNYQLQRDREPEHLKQIMAATRRRHRERRSEYNKQWIADNPGYSIKYRRRRLDSDPSYSEKERTKNHARRARKQNAPGSHTDADIRLQYESQRGLCWYCLQSVGDKYHVDHRVPLSRGGSDAPNNLVIACEHCNLSKHDKLPHEWNGRLF